MTTVLASDLHHDALNHDRWQWITHDGIFSQIRKANKSLKLIIFFTPASCDRPIISIQIYEKQNFCWRTLRPINRCRHRRAPQFVNKRNWKTHSSCRGGWAVACCVQGAETVIGQGLFIFAPTKVNWSMIILKTETFLPNSFVFVTRPPPPPARQQFIITQCSPAEAPTSLSNEFMSSRLVYTVLLDTIPNYRFLAIVPVVVTPPPPKGSEEEADRPAIRGPLKEDGQPASQPAEAA